MRTIYDNREVVIKEIQGRSDRSAKIGGFCLVRVEEAGMRRYDKIIMNRA